MQKPSDLGKGPQTSDQIEALNNTLISFGKTEQRTNAQTSNNKMVNVALSHQVHAMLSYSSRKPIQRVN